MAQEKRRVSLTNARGQLSDMVRRAEVVHERTIISNHGKDVAALISAKELAYFERLAEEAQDRQDVADAAAAIEEAERVGYHSFDEVASRLGI